MSALVGKGKEIGIDKGPPCSRILTDMIFCDYSQPPTESGIIVEERRTPSRARKGALV